MTDEPIGVFDSGLGGLTVHKHKSLIERVQADMDSCNRKTRPLRFQSTW